MKSVLLNRLASRLLMMLAALLMAATSFAAPQAGAAWNQTVKFNFVNGTKGQYPDSQIHWAIVGKKWVDPNDKDAREPFVYVDLNGNLKEMSLDDNGALIKDGRAYANYFHTLAEQKSVTVPLINSARILFSVGPEPMYIEVNKDVNGKLAYAGANIEAANDANLNVIFDFVEMAIPPNDGIYINTTRVDHFGFPIRLRLEGADGYDQEVGEIEGLSRDKIFSDFSMIEPAEFRSLVNAPYRIIAPGHGSFREGEKDAHYLDRYISDVWEKYRLEDLKFKIYANDRLVTLTGRVQTDGSFQFTADDSDDVYRIQRKPTTVEALLGNGVLDDPSGVDQKNGSAIRRQLQVQAQLCAALNRHVAETPEKWADAASYYPAGKPSNAYSKFWHDRSINQLSYGFAYDDVWNASPSLHTRSPNTATITIGW